MILIQQLAEKVSRAYLVSVSSSVPGGGTDFSAALNAAIAAAITAASSAAAAAAAAATAAANALTYAGANSITPVNLASASTVAIGASNAYNINLTGNTTVNAFDIIAAGTTRYVVYQGAIPITYNAASMQLVGQATRTNAAGDVSIFESLGGGNWKELVYQQLSGVTNFLKKYIPAGSAFTTVVLTPAQSGSFIKLMNTYATLPALAQGLTYTFIGPGTINAGYAVAVYFPDNTSTSGMPSISVGYGCSLEIGCDGISWFVYNMAGDVMLTQASGLTHRAVRSDQVLGIGQTYQDMTGLGGRASGTNIYNGSAQPIMVYVETNNGVNYDATVTATVGGTSFVVGRDNNSSGGTTAAGSVLVPAGTWYSLVASGPGVSGFLKWWELR